MRFNIKAAVTAVCLVAYFLIWVALVSEPISIAWGIGWMAMGFGVWVYLMESVSHK